MQPSDSDLERRISAILLGDSRTADAVQGIDVDVAAGIAVLSGTARSQEQADVAGLLVRKVPGVTRVDNYLAIKAPPSEPPTPPPPTDAEILDTIRHELGADTKIEVAVDAGVVTLAGLANSEEVRDATAIVKRLRSKRQGPGITDATLAREIGGEDARSMEQEGRTSVPARRQIRIGARSFRRASQGDRRSHG